MPRPASSWRVRCGRPPDPAMTLYDNPTRIGFGRGAFDTLPRCIAGRRYALVTYADPPFAALARRLAEAAPPALLLADVTPNPDRADLACWCDRDWGGIELVVALGGGSAIDSGKILALARGEPARIDANLAGAPAERALPLIAVPTTAGTGSEVTRWATLWDRAAGRKHSVAGPALYPEQALVDPLLMRSAPAGVTLAAGLDALSHALESLWNVNANPLSAAYGVAAARTILATLPALMADLDDLDLREALAQAALFAGLAFSNTKTALAHSLSYPITLQHGTAHGIACSFSLPRVMRGAIGASAACDAALAQVFGPDLAAGAAALARFLGDLGVATEPAAYGLDAAGWHALVEHAAEGERGRNYIGKKELVLS